MRLALAQINTVVGDLDGNRKLILERLDDAKANAADLVLFPELAVTGYPPEDLLLRPGFIRAAEKSSRRSRARRAARPCSSAAPHFDRDLYNACYVLLGRRGEGRRVASASCRTTASSTRTGTSRRAAT